MSDLPAVFHSAQMFAYLLAELRQIDLEPIHFGPRILVFQAST